MVQNRHNNLRLSGLLIPEKPWNIFPPVGYPWAFINPGSGEDSTGSSIKNDIPTIFCMSRLADPKIQMAIRNLPLAAKTTVEGFMAGRHASTTKGAGMEFSQYRSYQAGDDLRLLDWKMFARSDRYYIRESEVETTISVKFLVDASASMNHKDGAFTKIEYARYLAASLAYLAERQGDATALHIFQSGKLYSLPYRKDSMHLTRLFHQLEAIAPSGAFTEPVAYKTLFPANPRKEILVFITDYYQRAGEITSLLEALSASKHEIIVFHLFGRNEMERDFKGYTALEDLETGQVVRIDNVVNDKGYKEKLHSFISDTKNGLLKLNTEYRTIVMDEPVDKALSDFLQKRNKMGANL